MLWLSVKANYNLIIIRSLSELYETCVRIASRRLQKIKEKNISYLWNDFRSWSRKIHQVLRIGLESGSEFKKFNQPDRKIFGLNGFYSKAFLRFISYLPNAYNIHILSVAFGIVLLNYLSQSNNQKQKNQKNKKRRKFRFRLLLCVCETICLLRQMTRLLLLCNADSIFLSYLFLGFFILLPKKHTCSNDCI